MPKKRPLGGAAKDGREHRMARLHDCPIKTELKRLDARASSSTASVTDAISRLQKYEKSRENDKTDSVLLELLQALPDEGICNLARDIVGRDDKDLEELGTDVRIVLFSFRTGSRVQVSKRSDISRAYGQLSTH